ncbi:MAG: NADH-quinone oxidoreductase subunit NuoF [Deltaproteobacteria bacterium]|nr:NADH-quinone oxidoreductase subunit NuoF [Deltaproteobacteria bacterium]
MCRLENTAAYEAYRKELLDARAGDAPTVAVCAGTGCLAMGAKGVIEAFESAIEEKGLDATVGVKRAGCPGFCERGPVVVIHPEETCYLQVKPEDVAEIVEQTLAGGKVVERLLYEDAASGARSQRESEIPFYAHQERRLLASNIKLDSRKIDDYVALGGYSALAKALSSMSAQDVLDEVKNANLRGRGGAGFPAGRKWEGSRDAPADERFVIVNADEGDPGAFMDRALLEGNPHSILEGLILGAYAIGAHQGYVYVRQEYPLAVDNLLHAIEEATRLGFLGEDILGSGFDFVVHVHRGAGAFVCGESTALMTALEGRVGEPRPKYVRSNVKGLWGKPSVLNNVETWANVPLIINHGAEWFTKVGTETSKGTKIFSLVGKITNTGLVEVPMGMTLRQIVEDIGGGVPGGKKFKAVQTGGPSGGCIPESMLDLPVGFDELSDVGSMMGSGGMIVMDEDTCMVDVARYFTEFLTDESCGKCIPCREGLRQMLRLLNKIVEGKGTREDLATLEEISEVTSVASLCALGKSAPAPLLSTLKYFREEFEAHIDEKRCPALSCNEMVRYWIDPDACKACLICTRHCPSEAISGAKKQIHVIDQELCNGCGSCWEVCPDKFDAIRRISGAPVPDPLPEDQREVRA